VDRSFRYSTIKMWRYLTFWKSKDLLKYSLKNKRLQWTTVHWVLLSGFVLALFIVLGLSLYAWGIFTRQHDVEDSMSQTMFHLEQLDRISKILQEAVISERGYILTGTPQYAENYRRAKNSLEYQINYLLLRVTTPKDQQYCSSVDSLIDKSLAVMDRRMTIRKEVGAEAAIQAIKGSGIEHDVSHVEEILLQYKKYERAGLNGEINRMRSNYDHSLVFYGAGMLLSIILFVIVYSQLNRQIRRRQVAEIELRDSRRRLQEAQRIAHIGHWEWDIVSDTITWSREVYSICGIHADVTEKDYESFLEIVHPDDRDHINDVVQESLKSGELQSVDHRIIHPDGSEYQVQQQGEVEYNDSGQPIRIMGTIQDITQRKRDEEAIRAREELLRNVVESAPIIIFVIDKDGTFTFSEGKGLEQLGLEPEEISGKSVYDIYSDVPEIIENFHRAIQGEDFVLDVEVGDIIFETRYSPLYTSDGQISNVLGVATDITERRRSEERLQNAYDELEDRINERTEELVESNKVLIDEIEERRRIEERLKTSLHEKEILLKEIHHRVKNNLQVISSLLFLQSKKVDDAKVMASLQESQNRVRTMALIHEKLYQSGDFTAIDFGKYLEEIVRFLQTTYRDQSKHIEFQIDADHLELGLDYAIPCGLMVNELVSNSLKHAFNGRENGTVQIQMHSRESGTIELIVEDNGVGMPQDLDIRETRSLGMQLIHNLVTQIDGNLSVENKDGTQFKILFKKQVNGDE